MKNGEDICEEILIHLHHGIKTYDILLKNSAVSEDLNSWVIYKALKNEYRELLNYFGNLRLKGIDNDL